MLRQKEAVPSVRRLTFRQPKTKTLLYPLKPILEARGVVKRYAAHTALSGVDVAVPQGTIFGLLGPNGAGKTSLIRIINQITAPDEGEVYFEGEPLQPKHIGRIGYLPEERGLYKKMKVGEQLEYLAQLKGLSAREARARLKHWFTKFGIQDWWTKNVEDLSKGMQQKTQFIATIVHEPSLIILDEPFSGFDPINANLLKDEILELKRNGSTIIFSTHRMESVEELCDAITLINRSKVVLSGEKRAIKQEFKDNSYAVEYTGTLGALPPHFEVLRTDEPEPGYHRAQIRLAGDTSVNALLGALIGQVEVRAFRENIPSFNDIFIRVVGGETVPDLA
jgi:ABC-2 type transport system ATP-binding protein